MLDVNRINRFQDIEVSELVRGFYFILYAVIVRFVILEHKNKSKPEEITKLTLPSVESQPKEAKNRNVSQDNDGI